MFRRATFEIGGGNMAWKKSPQQLVDRFNAALPKAADVQPRKMFGYACAFVNGNFFSGLFEDGVVIRLPDGLRDRFPELANAKGFNPMKTANGMKDWYEIPKVIAGSGERLKKLLAATHVEVRKLPPKVRKSVRAKTRVGTGAAARPSVVGATRGSRTAVRVGKTPR
jgi:TfoX/Sxy family transcriptional regulator of competence genes